MVAEGYEDSLLFSLSSMEWTAGLIPGETDKVAS